QTVVDTIRKLIPLAPLHNPANLTGIQACREIFPGVPQVAVFDTAFHQTMPPQAFRYAVPESWYSLHGIRRYGFHGSSHRYVANRAAGYLQRPLEDLKLITLHLGNGASAAAIQHGRCVDTSMGFTPLEGLVMGTRCGDLDAAIPLYLENVLGQKGDMLQETLNRDSGLKGLCGSNDLREVLAAERSGDERARLALDVYCYRIRKYIGAYFAALDGLDALIFTGGVGENAPSIRSRVCKGLEKLGIAIDPEANERPLEEIGEIGPRGHSVRVLAVRTNEELQIARETLSVLAG
ncbi:MAG: acetate/propionate family kinase, partial [Gammaproteobacteria bacterium]